MPDPLQKVLIVDDESAVRRIVVDLLAAEGFSALEAEDGQTGLALAISELPSLVILDIDLPSLGGLAALREINARARHVPVIMLTASDDVRTAVEAMRLGAWDYLTKPFEIDELVLRVRRALERHALMSEVEALKRRLADGDALGQLTGESSEIQDVVRRVGQVADSTFTVLIQGETGVGKELVARAIHQQSGRRGDFIALDCGTLPEALIESELFGYEKGAFTGADRRKDGLFQLAEGGTLFLDEAGNLPPATQVKLLRVLQERRIWPLGARAAIPVDVRVLAASNLPLDAEVRAGRFRQDLYYRLNEFTITVPPLRSRRADIPILARRFLAEASMELKRPVEGVSAAAAALLLEHSWPGNVRELRNVLRRAVLLSAGEIGAEHLDLEGRGPVAEAGEPGTPPPTLKEARDRGIAHAERQAIRWALTAAHGNKSEAARLLKTDYKTLHVKVKRYRLGAREVP